jgi:hypothetical protein
VTACWGMAGASACPACAKMTTIYIIAAESSRFILQHLISVLHGSLMCVLAA